MKKILIFSAILFTFHFSLFTSPVSAQYNETNNLFYNTFRTPQSNDLNPAFFPNKSSFYMSLPGLSMQFGSPLAIKDVLRNQGDTMTVIDLNHIFDALSADNNLHLGADVNLLGFGVKVNNMFFTFGSRIVTNINLNLPGDLVNAVRHGNTDPLGSPISEVNILRGDLFNTTAYAELALGGGYKIEPIGLTVGARVKYLYGLANVQTDNTSAILTTAPGFEEIRADIYYEFLTAGVAGIDSNGGISVDTKNLFKGNSGFAFDIGARYDVGPFSFSFAIDDLSAGIHWNTNINAVRPKDGHITLTFGGQDASSMLHGGRLNTDSLANVYQNLINGVRPSSTSKASDYWYSIPTRIYLGGNFNFAKKFRAGVLFHGQLDRGLLSKKTVSELNVSNVTNTFRFNTTLTFGLNLFNWAEFIVGSSIVYDANKVDFLNPGVGVVLTPATIIQIYLMGDYVSNIYLVDAKDFNVKLGLNLLLGNGGNGRLSQD